MKKNNKNKKDRVRSYPKPLSKRQVLKFALHQHSPRPMVFWEMARVWDGVELATDECGEVSKEAFLRNASALYDYLSDDQSALNRNSAVLVVQARVPTSKYYIRLCEKYGYKTTNDDGDSPDDD